MNFHVLTLFPEMIEQGMATSIIGRARENGYISLKTINIRDFSVNKHNKVDDYPYGGGAGMVMEAEPVFQAYQKAMEGTASKHPRVIYLNPQGVTFHQKLCRELAKEEDLIFLCGHYEGIDSRVLDEIVTDHISIGDYVLTGGELPAMVLMDAISRYVPGVLHNDTSTDEESFSAGLLEYPQYTRPEVWHEKEVPKVLLSGHHQNIEDYRRLKSIQTTIASRPDLLSGLFLGKRDKKLLENPKDQRFPKLTEWIRDRIELRPTEEKGVYSVVKREE